MKTSTNTLWCAIFGGMLLAATPAFAVHELHLFELEGGLGNADAVDDSSITGVDWENVFNNTDGAIVETGIVADPAPQSIFTGGRKDIQQIGEWGHKSGAVPDKDDLTNAYAAAYSDHGDLIIYFGADRFSNVGDAFMGFWFFQDEVVDNPDGTFGGTHINGDILVLVNFPQGAKDEPLVQVVEWNDACLRADSAHPIVGDCVAPNLELLSSGTGDSGAVCNGGGDDVCANTNFNDETSPWPYLAKDGTSGAFPFESFFEGGINITDLVGGDTCFSSFMAESRTSESFTASLKDFVLHSFELCSLAITKDCTDTQLNATDTAFINTFSGTVTNTGFGTLHDVTVVDITGGQTFNLGTLAAGASTTYGPATFESTLNPATNSARVEAAAVSGGPKTVTAGPVSDTCPGLSLSPVIDVTKDCDVRLAVQNSAIVVVVDIAGMVCNTTGGDNPEAGPISLNNVTVVDDSGTPGNTADDQLLISGITLPPGACRTYSSSYIPRALPLDGGSPITDPSLVSFSDTVTATGDAPLSFGEALDTASATCPICE